ncbi:folate-binding protein YgfZ [Neisseria sp. ZJ106]|uniref:Folate-binding protein YgfZ n=1 Tax=Neisseria lisongii TaxID=2912188 RepID=A0ABY7RLN8_9NEIS|nr:folate-binding protein YgfZ [Neisseria lisongii]MCF7521680.1 folate-binding protein YgfZ [Neisseria lisongii]WCL72233.1 folate-binding protein YgfZ [Neisseria lisongii]
MHTSRLPFFGVARVSGDERTAFLHGQLSNHIEALQANEACYATYNTPKGRVIANMLVINRGDDLLLVMAADLLESVIKRLRMFVLRAKVVFEPLPDFAVACELDDKAKAQTAAEPCFTFPAATENGITTVALPHTGRLKIGLADDLPAYQADAENTWQLHEIQSGYPWISAATKETAVAQMLNQHTIGGVHFKKGCYPGQEIIARAQYRGQVKRGLAILSGNNNPAAGTAVEHNGEEAGIIINAARNGGQTLSLAVIKFAAAQAALSDSNGNPLQVEQRFFQIDSE